jgi:hypothetical protein
VIVAYVPDLMDRSKVAAAAPGVRFVGSPSDLAATASDGVKFVVDLSRPGVLDAVRSLVSAGAVVIGFGSHVDRELLERARAAGCERVLARSAFFARVREELGVED